MPTATMTSKGQLTIPKEVRDELGLKPGDKVGIVVTRDGTARLRRKRPLAEVLGTLPTNGIHATLEDFERGLAETMRRRHPTR